MNPTIHAPYTAHPALEQPTQAYTPAPRIRHPFWEDFPLEDIASMKRNTLYFCIDAVLEYLGNCPDDSPYPKNLKTFLMTAYLDYRETQDKLDREGGEA